MKWELIANSLLVGFVSAAFATLFTHYLLKWLDRRKARRELICKRIEELEERICDWLQIFPLENKDINQDAVPKRLFELALTRLERLLSADQKKALAANCLDLRNLSMTHQAQKELKQLFQNLDALHKAINRP